jgi:hypothetical protein
MPYPLRNADGKIVALLDETAATTEFLPPEHPEVLQFLVRPSAAGHAGTDLALALEDLKLIRVIEDIIDLLIAKNVIIFSDLPLVVQQKILKKRGCRERLFGNGGDLIGPEESIL